MTRLTAILHAYNDGLRVGRCLETLYPCDDLLIVDHGSSDATSRVAREYGAKIVSAGDGRAPNEYAAAVEAGWILCLDPRESLSEALAASLYEWKTSRAADRAYSVFMREETPQGWVENPAPQTRLVQSDWTRWRGYFPAEETSTQTLEGQLLRFVLP